MNKYGKIVFYFIWGRRKGRDKKQRNIISEVTVSTFLEWRNKDNKFWNISNYEWCLTLKIHDWLSGRCSNKIFNIVFFKYKISF